MLALVLFKKVYFSLYLAREYIHYVADAIREKVAGTVANKKFMAMLSNGSQARKTNDEKELLLLRIEKEGVPVYLVGSLLEMADFGGTDAPSLKNALDSVFNDTGNAPLADYETKLVSATSDRANVNLGVYNGALTQLAHGKPWLVTVQCVVNHRLELAMKDTISQIIDYQECDRFYTTIFYLFKNSGKLETLAKKEAETLNITWYRSTKLNGTRFVGHRHRALKKLLHNWPALLTAFTDFLSSERNNKKETRAKVTGILNTLKSYRFLCTMAPYLDIVENITPLSMVFENNLLMAYEVVPVVQETIARLETLSEESADELSQDSFLHMFKIKDEDDLITVIANYPKARHERRDEVNCEYAEIELEVTKYVNYVSVTAGTSKRC